MYDLLLHEKKRKINELNSRDGKKSYHTLTRVLFQDQNVTDTQQQPVKCIKKILEKTLSGKDHLKDYIAALPYEKPKTRLEPSQYTNFYNQIVKVMIKSNDFSFIEDITWSLLREVSRDLSNKNQDLNSISNQVIPMWT